MTSALSYQCQLCNTCLSPARVEEQHKTLCVACELAEARLDILTQATTPHSRHPHPAWLASTWAPYTKQEEPHEPPPTN